MNYIKPAILVLCLSSSPAFANLVSNGDFEQPGTVSTYQYLANGDTSVTGWTAIDDGVGEKSYLMNKNRPGGNYTNRVYEGIFGLALNQGASIQAPVALVAGTTYDLSFVAKANVATASALEVSIAGFNTSFANTLSFTNFQFQFTASNTDPLVTLSFLNPSTNGGNRVWNLDAISIEPAPVPLPAAAWTFLTGLMGYLAIAKRKKSII